MTNLATLPPAEREAIERDKANWLKAYQMVKSMTAEQISRWIAQQQDPAYKNEMQQKLRTCWRNNSGTKQQ
jgi:hypothetical protein